MKSSKKQKEREDVEDDKKELIRAEQEEQEQEEEEEEEDSSSSRSGKGEAEEEFVSDVAQKWAVVMTLAQFGIFIGIGGITPLLSGARTDDNPLYAAHVSGAAAIILFLLPPQWSPYYTPTKKEKEIFKDDGDRTQTEGSGKFKFMSMLAGIGMWMTCVQLILYTLQKSNHAVRLDMMGWVPVIGFCLSAICCLFERLRVTLTWIPLLSSISVIVLLVSTVSDISNLQDNQMNCDIPNCPNNTTTPVPAMTNSTSSVGTFSGKTAIAFGFAVGSMPVFFLVIGMCVILRLTETAYEKCKQKVNDTYFDMSMTFSMSILFFAFWLHGDRWDTVYSVGTAKQYLPVYLTMLGLFAFRRWFYTGFWRNILIDIKRKNITIYEAIHRNFGCAKCCRSIKNKIVNSQKE